MMKKNAKKRFSPALIPIMVVAVFLVVVTYLSRNTPKGHGGRLPLPIPRFESKPPDKPDIEIKLPFALPGTDGGESTAQGGLPQPEDVEAAGENEETPLPPYRKKQRNPPAGARKITAPLLITPEAPLIMELIVSEDDAALLSEGSIVMFDVRELPGERWTAAVIAADASSDPLARTRTLRLRLADRDFRLHSGMLAEIQREPSNTTSP